MKIRHLLFVALVLASGGAWAGGDRTLSGAELHASNCTSCHGAEIYTRPQRLVNTYAELRQRVQQCELNAELGWFEEEVAAVISYLNEEFYRFAAEK